MDLDSSLKMYILSGKLASISIQLKTQSYVSPEVIRQKPERFKFLKQDYFKIS